MTIHRWLILVLFILIIGMICCPCQEGLSQASATARYTYNREKKQTNAKNYFTTVIFDSSATNGEKQDAAYAYRSNTSKGWHTGWWLWRRWRDNQEYLYADAAWQYFLKPSKTRGKIYFEKANAAGDSPENRFKAALEYYKHIQENEIEKSSMKYELFKIVTPIIFSNSTRKETIINDYYEATTPLAQKNYDKAKAQYNKTISSGTPEQKYVDAKAYYEATVLWKETTNQQKYETAKAYYDATKSYGSSKQKYDAARAYYDDTTRWYGTASQKYEAAEAYYNATMSYGSTTRWQRFYTAREYYNTSISYGTAPQKFIAAKSYYNSIYHWRTPEQKYAAAKAYYDATIVSGSNATTDDFYECRKACYTYALQDNKYIAAKNLLDYIDINPGSKNKIPNVPDTDIAKSLYDNSPDGVKYDSALRWYNMAKSTAAAQAYYTESKNRSCNDKCLATKAYFENGGSTDTNIGYERNYYIGLMGDDCNKAPEKGCDIPTKQGFQNREPMTQCQQATQKPIFKSAENAFLSYNTTPNQKYSEIDTMNIYFKSATKENGLNTNDIMNVAKNRVKYMQSMKIIDYEALRFAALDYYNASLGLDCGDISLNRYLAIKTYYEIAEKSANADKLDLSKKYYKHTVDMVNLVDITDAKYHDHVKVYHPIQYAVAKIWDANSQSRDCDAARAKYKSAMLPFSGTTDQEKYDVLIVYQKLGCGLTHTENIELAKLKAALSDRTDQTQTIQHDAAKSAYNIMDAFTNFSEAPENCDCNTTTGMTKMCAAYCAYDKAETPNQKLIDAQDWSGINYKKDIVDRRSELDVELAKLNQNAEVNIQKMDLDSTIMMNIAATVLASSLIVFSITKL